MKTHLKTTLLQSLTAAVLCTQAAVVTHANDHLADAIQLATEIRTQGTNGVFTNGQGVSLNRYGGSWEDLNNASFIQFKDDNAGVLPMAHSTCAPFVSHILQYSHGWDWSAYSFNDPILNEEVSTESPASYQYLTLMKGLIGFSSWTTDLDDVQPGDIAAIQNDGTASGHTMIVVSVNRSLVGQTRPKAYLTGLTDSDAQYTGTTYYEVTVVDCSEDKHTDDTRLFYNAQGALTKSTTGVGMGVIGVLVDGAGNVVAHSWSLPTRSLYFSNYASTRNSWVKSLNGRLQKQTGVGKRELVFGRLALP